MNTSFLGPMIWFTGVVEDVNDPEQLGRAKVRCYGYHTDDKNVLPTTDLPWASPIVPITSASMAGVGVSATGLQAGSWIVGFFKDGSAAQDPVMLGSIPSQSFKKNPANGFCDPLGINPRINGPDIPKMATSSFSESQHFIKRKSNRKVDVPIAVSPGLEATQEKEDSERETWSNYDPVEHVRPVYPLNHVTESQSGHVTEVDDRPGFTRLSRMHKSGTYEEIINNGTKTVTVVNDEFEVTIGAKNMYVKGNVNLTVDGSMKTLVGGDYVLEVGGNKTEYIRGSSHTKIGGNEIKEIKSARNTSIVGTDSLTVNGDKSDTLNSNFKQTIAKNTNILNSGNRSLKILGTDKRFCKLTGFNLISPAEGPQTLKVGPKGLKIDVDGNIDIIAGLNLTEKATAIYMN